MNQRAMHLEKQEMNTHTLTEGTTKIIQKKIQDNV